MNISKPTMPTQKKGRPQIPEKIQLELWLKAGGRCEFPGCNKPLWHEGLTLRAGNYAEIAHIVSYSSSGPRGDHTLSPKLKHDITNLMLLCREHHKLVDLKEYEAKYPRKQLEAYKAAHEKRIQIVTSIKDDTKSTPLRLKCNIQPDINVEIPDAQMYEAMLRDEIYPSEHDISIDLTSLKPPVDESDWIVCKNQIEQHIQTGLLPRMRSKTSERISVFALAPIPLLCLLGSLLPQSALVDVYQLNRRTGKWGLGLNRPSELRYRIGMPKHTGKAKDVVLTIAISGKIDCKDLAIDNSWPQYSITSSKIEASLMQSDDDINRFINAYMLVIGKIRARHGSGCRVHVFPAVSAVIAINCGRHLLPKADPELLIYDYNKRQGGFYRTLTINPS